MNNFDELTKLSASAKQHFCPFVYLLYSVGFCDCVVCNLQECRLARVYFSSVTNANYVIYITTILKRKNGFNLIPFLFLF